MTRTVFFALVFAMGCTPVEEDTQDTARDTGFTEDTAVEAPADFEILAVVVEHGSALRVKVDTSTPALSARLTIRGPGYEEEWALEDIEPGDPCDSPEQGDGTRWGLCEAGSGWAPTRARGTGEGTVYATGPDGEGRYAEISVEVDI